MHRELLIKAFEKAKEEIGSEVPQRMAAHLSDFILEDSGEPYGERSLRDYYKIALTDSERSVEFKQFVVTALCHYLGYEVFHEFQTKKYDAIKTSKPITSKTKSLFVNYRIPIVLLCCIIFGFTIYKFMDRQRWMEWQVDHYEEVNYDQNKLSHDVLKLHSEDRIENFKQIIPDCKTDFFNEDGSENLWYGKNANGALDYFTSHGLHPETGRTLKKITVYMIRKHICEGYKR